MYLYQHLLAFLVLISCLIVVQPQINDHRMTMCEDCKENGNSSRSEHARLFQFNAEDSKIKVELSFSVPFISLPVPFSSTVATGTPQPINVDLGALAAAGVLSVAGYVFAPSVFTGLQPTATLERKLDGGLAKIWNQVEKNLFEKEIDASACTQRALCQAVHTARNRMSTGNAASVDKIVDGLATNSWLQRFLEGTAIFEAVSRGQNYGDCARYYRDCKLTPDGLRDVLGNFLNTKSAID